MSKPFCFFRLCAGLLSYCLATAASIAQPTSPANLKPVIATLSPAASNAAILGVAKAGSRVVAVGDHGVVLLSDDGISFRQAKHVPVSSGLTSVSFVDERNGWASGHWGVVMNTSDAGETWTIQRIETSVDRPIFSIHFWNSNEGIAVGLWSLILKTNDGGKTWAEVKPTTPAELQKTEINLYSIFGKGPHNIHVAGERGYVLSSSDGGTSWKFDNTGVKASLWAGAVSEQGELFVGGLRGAFLKSSNQGSTWTTVDLGTKNSITAIVAEGMHVAAFGIDGLAAISNDRGTTYLNANRADRKSITSAMHTKGGYLLFSDKGLVGELGIER